jgi:hypothetical protein
MEQRNVLALDEHSLNATICKRKHATAMEHPEGNDVMVFSQHDQRKHLVIFDERTKCKKSKLISCGSGVILESYWNFKTTGFPMCAFLPTW